MSARKQITIFDTTLRDGEQSPGCSMTWAEKLRLAHQLDRLGVDVIEAGFPIASDGDFRAVQAVAREVRRPVIAALARCCRDDIERAWQALAGAAHPRIHTFLATSDIHLQHKLKISRRECVEQARDAVRLAKSYCQDVEFSAEDATRFLHQACRGLPNLCNGKALAQHTAPHAAPVAQSLAKDDAFYMAVFEHALAFFGSRILYPARPALRDADLADLFDVTREDLEQQTSLPFADAVDALDFLTQHRERDFRVAQAPAFTGRKYEYVAEQLGYLTGNDLYDAYLEGRLTTAALRKLFLIHIEQPGVAREAYIQLKTRLRSGQRA